MADVAARQVSTNERTSQGKKTRGVKPYIFAVGRRREAVARVRLYNPTSGRVDVFNTPYVKGDVIVNGKKIEEYFNFLSYGPRYRRLLQQANADGKYIFSIKVAGGGLSGQLDAILHGMARALDKLDHEKYHKALKSKGYLTRDPRARERRKVGTGGKARRKKQSPKR